MVKRSPEYQVSELENVTDSNPVRIAPRSQAPSPESAASQSGSIQVPATRREVHQCDCDASSERMTALENTCSDLKDKFTALQGEFEELKSIVKPDLNTSVITADVPTADVHEDDVITSADVKDEPEMMAIGESIIIDTPSPVMTVSVESWGNGDNVPEHTISHPADSPPTDCICMQREELRAQLSTPLEQDPAAEIAHDLQTDVF